MEIVAVYDGEKTAYIAGEKKSVQIVDGTYARIETIQELWISLRERGGFPLSECLAGPDVTYKGKQSVDGEVCLVLNVRESDCNYDMWLSQDYGYRAKRLKTYLQNQKTGQEEGAIIEVTEFLEVNPGIFVPAKGSVSTWQADADQRETVKRGIDWRMTQYMKNPADDDFELEVSPGQKVYDLASS